MTAHQRKPGILVLLTFFLAFNSLLGQHYNFISYSTESGLAQSQVRAIAQDKNGYLWLGTMAGLSKYDGKKFVKYSIQNGLIDNLISSLAVDRSMGLWIGTMGGLNYFDGEKFRSYPFKQDMAENIINAIAQDTYGDLWLATDGSGICRFKGGKFEYFGEEAGILDKSIRTICVDDKGWIWFGGKNGIWFYNGKGFNRLVSSIPQPKNVSHIFMDKHKKLWFCTFGEGVYSYDGKVFKNYNESNGLIRDWVRSATEDSYGNLWFASLLGLSKFDGRQFTNFTEAEGLPSDNTNIVFEDKEKNIWIGTEGKGLCKFLGETFTSLTTNDGLSSNSVLSVLEDKDQNLWFSTFGKGITKMTKNKIVKYSISDDGLNSNYIWASLKDKQNYLWFCTSAGVSRFDGKKFRNYGVEDGLSAQTVFSVCEDDKGNLWFGTTRGISVFDGVNFKNYINGVDNIGKEVTSIVEDKEKRLWFATKNGLYMLRDGEFTKYTTANGLANNHLISLAVDSRNNLWIGSRGGVTYYDGQKFSKIPIDLFNSNTIWFLVFDKRGFLWMGTSGGIYVLDTEEYVRSKKTKFRHYTIFDGLPGMECNQNATFRDHFGNIWMGTTEGVIKYDSNIEDLNSNVFEPITHISGVRLFLKDTNWAKVTKEIDPNTLLPKNLKVKYQTTHFTFDYIGIKLSNPSSVRYKYMLEGFDDSWSSATDATFATYSNLPSGKYTFKVIAGDLMGNWNRNPATFSFEILPPFWTKWWFILLCVLAGLFLLWGIYRLRVNEIRKKHQTQQLEYKSKLMLLEHQSLNSSMNRHFIFNALNSIQYYMDKEDKLSAHKYLSRFAKLIRMNLDSSMSNLVPASEEIDRLDLYLQIELMRFEDKFQYKISVAEDVDIESIEIPPMLLQPYVENCILHGILPSGKTGRIDIRVEHNSEQQVIFSIQDNGIGIEESKIRKLLTKNPHVSRGTSITAQRIQLLGATNNVNISINGPFELKDAENTVLGTRVELIIH